MNKCNHCGSEWTTAAENQKDTCPFCGKKLENANSSQPAARGRFQLSYDQKTLVQFLGDEKNVVIPTGITRIGAGAFHSYGVETVYIPDGVTEIGDNCFNGCKQSREVRIPSSVTYISDSAFKDTGKKTIIAEKGSYAWKKYAKPEAENKTVASIQPVEEKPVKKVFSAPSAKPTDYAKTAGTPISKAPINTPSTSNTPSAKELYEQQVDEFLALQQKKVQWAQLLGCEPSDRPWIIKASLFVSADKRAKNLIARIKNIHDQELLARIEAETNDGCVRLAAVENITDQDRLFSVVNDTQNPNIRRAAVERITDQSILKQLANNKHDIVRIAVARKIKDQKVLEQMALNDPEEHIRATVLNRLTGERILEQIALKDPNSNIRAAALERITDEAVLRKIAKIDSDEHIRITAFLRIATPSELKKYLMNSICSNDVSYLSRISNTSDLLDLAILAKCSNIRTAAVKRIPSNSLERKLLQVASEISNELTPINMINFQTIADKLRTQNPEFLKKTARVHSSEDVRFLAWEAMGWPFDESISAEERLKLKTPSKNILHCRKLKNIVEKSAELFVRRCETMSQNGQHSQEMVVYEDSSYDDYPFKSQRDAELVADILNNRLKKEGFANVSAKCTIVDSPYSSGYVVKISTSW